jgi:hypothetical protein
MASWISADALAEQRSHLPAIAYDRLWGNVWTTGSGDALSNDDIAAAVTASGPMTGEEPGFVFAAGLDLGIRKDLAALVVVGFDAGRFEIVPKPAAPVSTAMAAARELGLVPKPQQEPEQVFRPGSLRYRLADVRVWRPSGGRVDLADVEQSILELYSRFRFVLSIDPWQAEYLSSRLGKAGLPVELVPFVPSTLQQMATVTIEAFTNRAIDLYDHPGLLSDLRSLRVEEKQYGIRLSSPRGPGGHGDIAVGLALSLVAAKRCLQPADACVPYGGSVEAMIVWPPAPDDREELHEFSNVNMGEEQWMLRQWQR